MGGKARKREFAWHGLHIKEGKPVLLDGTPLPSTGFWLVHTGDVKICATGLHASRRAWDMLYYTPGDYITRVQVDDIVAETEDKLVCRKRKVLWGFDAAKVLRDFARNQALGCLDKWKDPVPEVVQRWLETGDESLRSAAESAAWSAAESAAWSAAGSASLYRANALLEEMLHAEAKRLGLIK
jgi:hypothetical protein